MYVEKMKSLSQVKSSSSASSPVKTVEEPLPNKYLDMFMKKGWALPVRSKFRFSFQQKDILYTCFMNGEKTGNKVSPEEAASIIREKLSPKDYVTVQQIRSLFSRWCKQFREGTLQAPKKITSTNDVSDAEDEDVDDCAEDDDDAVRYQNELTRIVQNACPQWNVKDWVVINYDNEMFPGEIISIEDDDSVVVDCMKECFAGRNCFRRPQPRDNKTAYDPHQIICAIKQPEKPTNSRGQVALAEDDVEKAMNLLRLNGK